MQPDRSQTSNEFMPRPMTDNILSKIPGELLSSTRNNLPQALPNGPDTQRVLLRLPDGTRAEVTFVKIKSKKGRSTRWFWTPDSAVMVEERGSST
jgi:hypothetical protein